MAFVPLKRVTQSGHQNVGIDIHVLLLKGVSNIEPDAVTNLLLLVLQLGYVLREAGGGEENSGTIRWRDFS